jgi:predicted phosphohydrolase
MDSGGVGGHVRRFGEALKFTQSAASEQWASEQMRLGWITDIHLNFVLLPKRKEFYANLAQQNLDALLLGGDIGQADSAPDFLAEMQDALPVPIYFVLGNHDFYRGSILSVRESISRVTAFYPRLQWLSKNRVVHLTEKTALVGHDSWADGRAGDFFASQVMLNDYVLIRELQCANKKDLYAMLNRLGDEAAEFLEMRVREALVSYHQVILLTHVPPFRDACWHEGHISSDDFLPHFCCQAVGTRLITIMKLHPKRKLTVLCGHTHGAGFASILPNLVVHTGGAEYGEPAVQCVFDV